MAGSKKSIDSVLESLNNIKANRWLDTEGDRNKVLSAAVSRLEALKDTF